LCGAVFHDRSTEGQSLTAQVAELKAAGCQRVFQEKINGARSDRKQLARLLAELDTGDTVMVTSWTWSARPGPGSSPWPTPGAIRRRHTAS
jgi:hypothetical protein